MHRSENHLRLMVAAQRGRASPGLRGEVAASMDAVWRWILRVKLDCSAFDDFTDVDRREAPRGEDRWRQTSVSFCPL